MIVIYTNNKPSEESQLLSNHKYTSVKVIEGNNFNDLLKESIHDE